MIDFEIPEKIAGIRNVVEMVAVNMMRPVSRYFDEHEHEIPWDYINFMHTATKAMGGTSMAASEGKKDGPRFGFQRLAVMGFDERSASPAEIEQMGELLAQALAGLLVKAEIFDIRPVGNQPQLMLRDATLD